MVLSDSTICCTWRSWCSSCESQREQAGQALDRGFANYSGKVESNFSPLNPNVQYLPSQFAWDPFPLPSPSESIDFVAGLQTIGGQGDSTTKEGLAVHIYAANASMEKKAFCSNDGDMLFLPQQGRLDIQTEYGRMMVRPGELCVIQAGMRFSVQLPDGIARGCELMKLDLRSDALLMPQSQISRKSLVATTNCLS